MRKFNYISTLFAAAMMVSCTAEDYYNTENGAAYREKYAQDMKNEFRQNFEETFGKISSTQSWDFTGDRTMHYGPATRATDAVSLGQEETFSRSFISSIKGVLTEGRDNSSLGGAYTLISQGPFDIYPLYHGKCMQWDLYVNDEFVASYGDIMDMMGVSTSYGEMTPKEITETGWHIDLPVGTPIFIKLVVTKCNTGGASYGEYANNGDVITSVYTNPIQITEFKNTGTLFRPKWEEVVVKEYKFGSLVLPQNKLSSFPSNLDQIIMFEDSKTTKTDADFNDFVLGIKGRDINPSPIDIITTEETTSFTTEEFDEGKRYMIEDLGSTDDFDYNDVVVDVQRSRTIYHEVTTITTTKTQDGKTIVSEDVEVTDTEGEWQTKAIIRALGGTLDFNLTIGDTKRKKSEITQGNPFAMFNTGTPTKEKDDKGFVIYNGSSIDFNANLYEFEVTGWDPELNNISFEVYPKRIANSNSVSSDQVDTYNPTYGEAWTITSKFPEQGETPFIIAVPVDQNWQTERVTFKALNDYIANKRNNGK